MLRTAMEFLSVELKAYVERRDPAIFQNKIDVLVSSLMKADGSFAISSSQKGATFGVVTALVNPEEDRIAASQQYYPKINDKVKLIETLNR